MHSLAFARSAVDATLGGIDSLARAGSIRITREIEHALQILSIAYLLAICFAGFRGRSHIQVLA
jgi:hypothetical protein